MKNLSTDLNIVSFQLNDFHVVAPAKCKQEIIDLIINFNKKATVFSGRGDVYKYQGLIIRKYRHGGILRKILRDWFFSPERFLNEFRIFEFLNINKFPTVEIKGLLIKKSFFFKGYIITGEVLHAKNLNNTFYEDCYFKCGKVAKCLHELNIIHGDMHLKNFIFDEFDNPYLIDFDKSFFSKNRDMRLKDIKRFIRSILKHNFFNEKKIEKKLIVTFLEGYGLDKSFIVDTRVKFKNKISWFLNKPK